MLGLFSFSGFSAGTGAAVSIFVASNLPSNSVGSSIFSEGRSSIGIKSSPPVRFNAGSSISSFSIGTGTGAGTAGVCFSVSLGADSCSFSNVVLFLLPGLRPRFALGFSATVSAFVVSV